MFQAKLELYSSVPLEELPHELGSGDVLANVAHRRSNSIETDLAGSLECGDLPPWPGMTTVPNLPQNHLRFVTTGGIIALDRITYGF